MVNEKIQYQINSAVNACYARIENSDELISVIVPNAFQWLQEELEQIYNGEILYEEQ